MDPFWLTLLGITGTLTGGLVGHILAKFEADRAWERNLELRKLEWQRDEEQRKLAWQREEEQRRLEWQREEEKRSKERVHAKRFEFDVDVQFIGLQGDQWIVSIVALVRNKGSVAHVIKHFEFDLRCMLRDEAAVDGDDSIDRQVFFPHTLIVGSWLPHDWEKGTFIEPGLSTKYSHYARVSTDASYLLLHGRFDYGERGRHTADTAVRVPTTIGTPDTDEQFTDYEASATTDPAAPAARKKALRQGARST